MKMFAKLALVSGILAAAGCASAQNAAKIFEPAQWQAVESKLPAGDAQAGKTAATKLFCQGCHGAEGISATAGTAHLAGQPFAVNAKAMYDYKNRFRTGTMAAGMMSAMLSRASDKDIADMSAYYASLPLPAPKAPKDAKEAAGKADALKLITKGDAARMITPCASCHTVTRQGNPNGQVPYLQGQDAKYLAASLTDYRSGKRASDMLKEMRAFAVKLTDAEIEALAAEYSYGSYSAFKK